MEHVLACCARQQGIACLGCAFGAGFANRRAGLRWIIGSLWFAMAPIVWILLILVAVITVVTLAGLGFVLVAGFVLVLRLKVFIYPPAPTLGLDRLIICVFVIVIVCDCVQGFLVLPAGLLLGGVCWLCCWY